VTAAANGLIVGSVVSWAATENGDVIRQTLNTHESADLILYSLHG
jgi:hypothetical protein